VLGNSHRTETRSLLEENPGTKIDVCIYNPNAILAKVV
jgi:hypothetical protein